MSANVSFLITIYLRFMIDKNSFCFHLHPSFYRELVEYVGDGMGKEGAFIPKC